MNMVLNVNLLYMISILRKPKNPETTLYTNCDIPAKLFFQVMDSGEYDKVGGEANFDMIFDEYYTLTLSPELKKWMVNNYKVESLILTIKSITNTLDAIEFLPMTKEQALKCVDILNSYDAIKRKFNPVPKLIVSEIARCRKIVSLLINQLNMFRDNFNATKKDIKNSFEKSLLSIRLNLDGLQVDENVSLYMYIELENAVKERIKSLKKVNNGK